MPINLKRDLDLLVQNGFRISSGVHRGDQNHWRSSVRGAYVIATPPEFPYDVFISYSHADQDWVWNWLIPRLKAEGLILCTDQESFDIGVPSLVNMENAVLASRHTLLVLTPAYVNSQWTLYEQILAQTQDPIGQRQRTLPVLREPCELPPRIAMLTYVDLREGANAEGQMCRLINAIRGSRTLPDPQRVPVGRTPVTAAGGHPGSAVAACLSAYVEHGGRARAAMAAFSDEELTTFCYDNFRPVYEEFTTGMSRTQKTQRLVETCERRGEMEIAGGGGTGQSVPVWPFRDHLRSTP